MKNSYIDWAFKTLLIGISTMALTQFEQMKDSVVELNVKMAVLIERDITRTRDIESLQGRTRKLEDKCFGGK